MKLKKIHQLTRNSKKLAICFSTDENPISFFFPFFLLASPKQSLSWQGQVTKGQTRVRNSESSRGGHCNGLPHQVSYDSQLSDKEKEWGFSSLRVRRRSGYSEGGVGLFKPASSKEKTRTKEKKPTRFFEKKLPKENEKTRTKEKWIFAWWDF